MVESYTLTMSDRACAAPAVAFGFTTKRRGSVLSVVAQDSHVRPHSTDDVAPGPSVWSPSA